MGKHLIIQIILISIFIVLIILFVVSSIQDKEGERSDLRLGFGISASILLLIAFYVGTKKAQSAVNAHLEQVEPV
jgi:hypothetical protein